MPVLIQICAVIVTTAVVAIAIAMVRALSRFDRAVEELSKTSLIARDSLGHLQSVAREAHEVIASFGEVAPHFKRVATRFEWLGDRAATLSNALLEEVETPLRTAVAVSKGLRTGTAFLFSKFIDKIKHSETNNGGFGHERDLSIQR